MEKKTMLDYIHEAVPTAKQNIEKAKELVDPLLNYLGEREIKRLWLVASGSSYNACFCANSFMEKYLPFEIKLVNPFTFVHYEHNVKEGDIVIVITQSGLSTNAIEAIKKTKELGYQAVCLTGNTQSDIKDYADLVLDYGVGEELVGYVTKGVTTLCLYFMLFTAIYTNHAELIKKVEQALLTNVEMIKKADVFIHQHYKNFSSMTQMYVCGAGNTTGVAMEGALKIGETIHIPSNCYEIEEFIHGPNLQLTPNYNVLIFDDNEEASDRVVQIYQATRKVTDRAYIISNHASLLGDDHALQLEQIVDAECCSFAYLPFVQLLSFYISNDLNSSKQHPLLREFKKIADAKTENFVNYDEDD